MYTFAIKGSKANRINMSFEAMFEEKRCLGKAIFEEDFLRKK